MGDKMDPKLIEWLSLNIFSPNGTDLRIYEDEKRAEKDIKRVANEFMKNHNVQVDKIEEDIRQARAVLKTIKDCEDVVLLREREKEDYDGLYIKCLAVLAKECGVVTDKKAYATELEQKWRQGSKVFLSELDSKKKVISEKQQDHDRNTDEMKVARLADIFNIIYNRYKDDKIGLDETYIALQKKLMSSKFGDLDNDEKDRRCVPSIRFSTDGELKRIYCIEKKYSYCENPKKDLYMRECTQCGCVFSTLLFDTRECPVCSDPRTVVTSVMNGKYADIDHKYVQALSEWAKDVYRSPPDDIDKSLGDHHLKPTDDQKKGFFDEMYRTPIEKIILGPIQDYLDRFSRFSTRFSENNYSELVKLRLDISKIPDPNDRNRAQSILGKKLDAKIFEFKTEYDKLKVKEFSEWLSKKDVTGANAAVLTDVRTRYSSLEDDQKALAKSEYDQWVSRFDKEKERIEANGFMSWLSGIPANAADPALLSEVNRRFSALGPGTQALAKARYDSWKDEYEAADIAKRMQDALRDFEAADIAMSESKLSAARALLAQCSSEAVANMVKRTPAFGRYGSCCDILVDKHAKIVSKSLESILAQIDFKNLDDAKIKLQQAGDLLEDLDDEVKEKIDPSLMSRFRGDKKTLRDLLDDRECERIMNSLEKFSLYDLEDKKEFCKDLRETISKATKGTRDRLEAKKIDDRLAEFDSIIKDLEDSQAVLAAKKPVLRGIRSSIGEEPDELRAAEKIYAGLTSDQKDRLDKELGVRISKVMADRRRALDAYVDADMAIDALPSSFGPQSARRISDADMAVEAIPAEFRDEYLTSANYAKLLGYKADLIKWQMIDIVEPFRATLEGVRSGVVSMGEKHQELKEMYDSLQPQLKTLVSGWESVTPGVPSSHSTIAQDSNGGANQPISLQRQPVQEQKPPAEDDLEKKALRAISSGDLEDYRVFMDAFPSNPNSNQLALRDSVFNRMEDKLSAQVKLINSSVRLGKNPSKDELKEMERMYNYLPPKLQSKVSKRLQTLLNR